MGFHGTTEEYEALAKKGEKGRTADEEKLYQKGSNIQSVRNLNHEANRSGGIFG